jgi:AraC-like DNA-binding protein
MPIYFMTEVVLEQQNCPSVELSDVMFRQHVMFLTLGDPAGIAQSVSMSPYHFTRLFKSSIGKSPHQYVIEARVKRAKDLLTTGKFGISEAAYLAEIVNPTSTLPRIALE